MTVAAGRDTLETQIARWRDDLRRRSVPAADIEKLDDRLRDQVAMLTAGGVTDDEAFLIAIKRMAKLDAPTRAFAREQFERLWDQLVLAPDADDDTGPSTWSEVSVVLGLAVAAAVAIKLPALFGFDFDSDELFYARNASLFVLPFLTLYFAWKRGLDAMTGTWLVLAFVSAAVFANIYPFGSSSDTGVLTALHLPIALWLAVGVAYVGGRWFAGGRRMDFVRFSGELAIYYVLIALGGGVLTAFTLMMFAAIGADAKWFVQSWLVPCGAMGAVLVAAWLVEAQQSVIDKMAPVLARLFTPLFTAMLLAFLATLLWTGRGIDIERNMLIGFDLLLVLVVGLVLYATSARDPLAAPNFFDRLQFLLVASALIVDGVALAAIAGRISEFGFTPNRVAALGENLILLVNLAGIAWFYARFIQGRDSFAALEQWQIAYLPVYSVWAALVVIVFPPLFGYR
jgi:hypothetical protein